MKNSNINHDLI